METVHKKSGLSSALESKTLWQDTYAKAAKETFAPLLSAIGPTKYEEIVEILNKTTDILENSGLNTESDEAYKKIGLADQETFLSFVPASV